MSHIAVNIFEGIHAFSYPVNIKIFTIKSIANKSPFNIRYIASYMHIIDNGTIIVVQVATLKVNFFTIRYSGWLSQQN